MATATELETIEDNTDSMIFDMVNEYRLVIDQKPHLDEIDVLEVNSRPVRKLGVDFIARNVYQNGIRPTVISLMQKGDRYEVLDGAHRTRALQQILGDAPELWESKFEKQYELCVTFHIFKEMPKRVALRYSHACNVRKQDTILLSVLDELVFFQQLLATFSDEEMGLVTTFTRRSSKNFAVGKPLNANAISSKPFGPDIGLVNKSRTERLVRVFNWIQRFDFWGLLMDHISNFDGDICQKIYSLRTLTKIKSFALGKKVICESLFAEAVFSRYLSNPDDIEKETIAYAVSMVNLFLTKTHGTNLSDESYMEKINETEQESIRKLLFTCDLDESLADWKSKKMRGMPPMLDSLRVQHECEVANRVVNESEVPRKRKKTHSRAKSTSQKKRRNLGKQRATGESKAFDLGDDNANIAEGDEVAAVAVGGAAVPSSQQELDEVAEDTDVDDGESDEVDELDESATDDGDDEDSADDILARLHERNVRCVGRSFDIDVDTELKGKAGIVFVNSVYKKHLDFETFVTKTCSDINFLLDSEGTAIILVDVFTAGTWKDQLTSSGLTVEPIIVQPKHHYFREGVANILLLLMCYKNQSHTFLTCFMRPTTLTSQNNLSPTLNYIENYCFPKLETTLKWDFSLEEANSEVHIYLLELFIQRHSFIENLVVDLSAPTLLSGGAALLHSRSYFGFEANMIHGVRRLQHFLINSSEVQEADKVGDITEQCKTLGLMELELLETKSFQPDKIQNFLKNRSEKTKPNPVYVATFDGRAYGVTIKQSESATNGYGLFALKPHQEGSVLGSYWGSMYFADPAKKDPSNSHRIIGTDKYRVKDGVKEFLQLDGSDYCCATFANDPRSLKKNTQVYKPNGEMITMDNFDGKTMMNMVYIRATRNIEKGSEIFINYGSNFFKE